MRGLDSKIGKFGVGTNCGTLGYLLISPRNPVPHQRPLGRSSFRQALSCHRSSAEINWGVRAVRFLYWGGPKNISNKASEAVVPTFEHHELVLKHVESLC